MASLHLLPPPSVMSMVLLRGALVLWLLVACGQWGAPAGIGREGYQWGKDISFPRSLHAESWNWSCHLQACLSQQRSLSTAVVTSPSLLPLNFPILLSLSFFFFFLILATLHSVWDIRSQTRDWPMPTAVEAQSPNNWTAREWPSSPFVTSGYCLFLLISLHFAHTSGMNSFLTFSSNYQVRMCHWLPAKTWLITQNFPKFLLTILNP